jgi:hypothetical protein
MHFSATQWLIMFGQVALSGLILEVMVRKKFRSTFPFFFVFVVFGLTSTLAVQALLYAMSRNVYHYVFFAVNAIGMLLAFGVMYEVFLQILKPYPALMDLGALLFRWAFVFLALASIFSAVSAGSPTSNRVLPGIQQSCELVLLGIQQSCDLMECGLLLLLALFESRLGLSWRSPTIFIMLGFGVYGVLDLAVSLMHSATAPWGSLGLVLQGSSIAVYLGWYICFSLPQPALRTAQDSPTRLILQRWNEVLVDTPLLGDKNTTDVTVAPVESFLPGVEKTVERIMASKMTH